MDKYNLIMDAEQQFAREVTLGVIVTRPLTAWHYLIPGFFIIDFLRRGSAIRQYTQHFMFPRKLAINVAAAQLQGQTDQTVSMDSSDSVKSWLESLNLYSPELVQAHLALIDILSEHYLKLLTTEGDEFNTLIERAYPDRGHFEEFIETITAAENEVDRQVMDLLGGNPNVREKMLAEQQQIAKRRQKILEQVF
ncbi:MAG: NF038143 family protein [Desulfobacterales bacterium]|nr:NF038143 family protein [Desulfobacterales bacterium]